MKKSLRFIYTEQPDSIETCMDESAYICPHTSRELHASKRLLPDFRISEEGVVYYTRAHSVEYGPEYFLKEYENQYGKSYLSDEENLRRLARRRLEKILTYRNISPAKNISIHISDIASIGHYHRPHLLEIGCAAGFFLDEAKRSGFDVCGVEISKYASDYARENLGLNVICAPFFEAELQDKYDVVAAFYVMEHFSDQKRFFKTILNLLKPGGIFVFACPSTNGPLFKTDIEAWKKSHPADHFADYSPESLQRIFPLYGMKFLKCWPASYHPSRVRGFSPWRFAGSTYPFWADRFCYGDTMEGVAIRE